MRLTIKSVCRSPTRRHVHFVFCDHAMQPQFYVQLGLSFTALIIPTFHFTFIVCRK